MKELDDRDDDLEPEAEIADELDADTASEKHYPSVNKDAVERRRRIEEQMEKRRRNIEFMDDFDYDI